MRTIALLAGLAAALPAQWTASINDPKSHGTVGDSLLSINEAIRIMNGHLSDRQLSAAERSRLSGIGPILTDIVIDAAVTPVVTMERELDLMFGLPTTHANSDITGRRGPNGYPVLDGTAVGTVIPLSTNHAHIVGLVIRGGKVGVDGDARLHFHPGDRTLLRNCTFVGQTEAAIRMRAPGGAPGGQIPARFERVTIRGAPVGIHLSDRSQAGGVDLVASHVRIEGGDIGIHAESTGAGANNTATFARSRITGARVGVQLSRDVSSDSNWTLRFVHGEFQATATAFDLTGTRLGATVLQHHHVELRGPTALRTQPGTALFEIHGGENVYGGNVLLQIGRRSRALRLENSRFVGGTVDLAHSGAAPQLRWLAFGSAPVTVAAATRTPVVLDACQLVGSPVVDRTTTGMTTLSSCFADAGSTLTNVVNRNPVPAAWIGQAGVSPREPTIGGQVDLTLDLPPGIAAAWLIGASVPRPDTSLAPYRFYIDLRAFVALAGLRVLKSTTRLPIPADRNLIGGELYAQPVAVPTRGQSWVPPWSLPAGGRFEIR